MKYGKPINHEGSMIFSAIKICLLVLILLLTVSPAETTLPPHPDERKAPPIKKSLARQKQVFRDTLINMDILLEKGILKINPGMTILDLGTGTGYNAYKFAEKLKGTGRVFATDILEDRIGYIVEEAKRRGLTNLYPVLVKREGVDEFYSKHRYDLIYLGNVYHRLTERVDYFKEMRNYLKKDGQLVVLSGKSVFPFYPDTITDFDGLVKELSLELRINKPFYDGLRESTRKLLKQKSWFGSDNTLKKALVEDFNRMLLNPRFYRNFISKFYLNTLSLTREEKNFIDWLLMGLKEDRVIDKNPQDLTPKEMRAVMKLNKMFFSQRFRIYLHRGKSDSTFGRSRVHKQTSKYLIKSELEEAGYKFDHEYDLLPYHVISFFTADRGLESEIR